MHNHRWSQRKWRLRNSDSTSVESDRLPDDRVTNTAASAAVAAAVESLVGQVPQLSQLDPDSLRQLAAAAHLEVLEEGVTLFREGDRGSNWYLVLSGTLTAFTASTDIPRCLGGGCGFGESIATARPRDCTVVTNECCQLLRVEQKHFLPIWQKNRDLIESLSRCQPVTARSSSSGYQLADRRISSAPAPPADSQSVSQHTYDITQPIHRPANRLSARKRFLPVVPTECRSTPMPRRVLASSVPAGCDRSDVKQYDHWQKTGNNAHDLLSIKPSQNTECSENAVSGSRFPSSTCIDLQNPSRTTTPPTELIQVVTEKTRSRFRDIRPFSATNSCLSFDRRPSNFTRRKLPSLKLCKTALSQSFDKPVFSFANGLKINKSRERISDEASEVPVANECRAQSQNESKCLSTESVEQRHSDPDPFTAGADRTPSDSPSQGCGYRSPVDDKTDSSNLSGRWGSVDQPEPATPIDPASGSDTNADQNKESENMCLSSLPALNKCESVSGVVSVESQRDGESTQNTEQDDVAEGPVVEDQTSPEERRSCSPSQDQQHDQIEPIFEPSDEMVAAARTIRVAMQLRCSQIFTERRRRQRVHRNCMPGALMVDWLSQAASHSRSRHQAAALWQVLHENGLIFHVEHLHAFKDKNLLYRFRDDIDVVGAMNMSAEEKRSAESQLPDALETLQKQASGAVFRAIVRKFPPNRTEEELEILFEHLVHVKALNHLSNSVRRELARVILFESHFRKGSVLFRQGDEGHSWYIILQGSVDVVIGGKGAVTSLFDADDFGNLALINDAPRAATIVCREDCCHFLRVNKADFNRVLRHVEANTVRLKEHGQDVLVLEKMPNDSTADNFKYCVMAGTPQKMLEHLLETRFDDRAGNTSAASHGGVLTTDTFLDDFMITHTVFFPFPSLAEELLNKYRGSSDCQLNQEVAIASKRAVLKFLHCWVSLVKEPALYDLTHSGSSFLQDLYHLIEADATQYEAQFSDETDLMMDLMRLKEQARSERHAFGVRKWKMGLHGSRVSLFNDNSGGEDAAEHNRPLQPHDEIIFRVYSADHTFCTLKCSLLTPASAIRANASDKLALTSKSLLLVELKSSGEKQTIDDQCTCVPLGLSLNGRLFIIPQDHLDALIPLGDQQGPNQSVGFDIEAFSTRDIAVTLTKTDWESFCKIHELEVLYHVLGRRQPDRVTANLDVFITRFNLYQHWVTSEMCLCGTVGKRLTLLKKFIKLASACRELYNLNAFFAIVMGLCNSAVTRLQHTWDRLPGKLRRTIQEFEVLLDPSRNHRTFRVYLASLRPPIIPLLPIIIKDMTFINEGNRTHLNHLINFEKMHMLAQPMRTLRYCRSRNQGDMTCSSSRVEAEIRRHLRSLHVIDNQKIFDSLSRKIESQKN